MIYVFKIQFDLYVLLNCNMYLISQLYEARKLHELPVIIAYMNSW